MKKILIAIAVLVLSINAYAFTSLSRFGFNIGEVESTTSSTSKPPAPKYWVFNVFSNKVYKVDIKPLGWKYHCAKCHNRTLITKYTKKKDLGNMEYCVKRHIGDSRFCTYSNEQTFIVVYQCQDCIKAVFAYEQLKLKAEQAKQLAQAQILSIK